MHIKDWNIILTCHAHFDKRVFDFQLYAVRPATGKAGSSVTNTPRPSFSGFKAARFFYVMSEARGLLQELTIEMIREIR